LSAARICRSSHPVARRSGPRSAPLGTDRTSVQITTMQPARRSCSWICESNGLRACNSRSHQTQDQNPLGS
jgi:hypothetical protein